MKINSLLKLIKKPPVYITAIVIIVVIILFMRSGTSSIQTSDLISVIRGNVSETVSVTGNTKSSSLVDLGFERTGRLAKIYAKVGDHVKAGDPIISLSNDDLASNVRAEEAKLSALLRGTRTEQLAIDESQAESAMTTFSNAQDSLVSTLHEVYVSADDSIRNKTDELFNDPRSTNPRYKYSISNDNQKLNINYNRLLVEESLNKFQSSLNDLVNDVDPTTYVGIAEKTLTEIKDFLTGLSLLVGDLNTSDGITQTNIDKYKGDVSSARASISSAISSLSSANDGYLSAQASLNIQKNQLNLALSGATSEDIQTEQALLDSARAALAKTIITAPFEGVVTRQDAILGEIVNANERIATVLDDKHFIIEANIPEVDIGHINLGNPVKITLDAFPGQEFIGSVSYIEPSETIVDGVVNFKIKVTLDQINANIKTGLTANLDIETQQKTNVLVLPQNALLDTDKGIFVRKIVDGKSTEVPVVVGIRGVDGNVEIISGVSLGDTVENVSLKK